MSNNCHICGPVRHEAPTVICAPCALTLEGRQHEAGLLAELIELRIMRTELQRYRDGHWMNTTSQANEYVDIVRRHIDDILALAPSARPA